MAIADDSFVTVLIVAHGRELKHIKATREQNLTLRRLAMAGKSGMLSLQGIPNMMPSIFYHARVLSQNTHIPFTEKLRSMSSHLCELGFNERLQNTYEELPELSVTCKAPTKHDWFSTSQVKYDHLYDFTVNDESDPWERDVLGIWLLDGSKDVLESEDFNPTKEKNNIMHQLGLPVWPLTHDQPTENHTFSTTMFDLETRLKNRYMVKHVNFVDLTCRYNPKSWVRRMSSWFVQSSDDDEMEDVTDATLEQVDMGGGVVVEILKNQPRRLPENWKYVKIPRNGAYVYANLETGEMSPDFPKYEMSLRTTKVDPPSITGTTPMELPPGWVYRQDPVTGAFFYVNLTTGEINPVVPRPFSYYGGKFARSKSKSKSKSKSNKRKCVRSKTKSRKPGHKINTSYEK
jgi:hypothetical protein